MQRAVAIPHADTLRGEALERLRAAAPTSRCGGYQLVRAGGRIQVAWWMRLGAADLPDLPVAVEHTAATICEADARSRDRFVAGEGPSGRWVARRLVGTARHRAGRKSPERGRRPTGTPVHELAPRDLRSASDSSARSSGYESGERTNPISELCT
jgi:hypothetical protein